ncbi:MAG: hypothetical protein M1820_006416 [Bogoriella megaspora]|nr:MAG: hypothetical protein M1820_006416 [Bogoriella megaspora]
MSDAVLRAGEPVPRPVEEFYDRHKSHMYQPDVFLIVDALDECTGGKRESPLDVLRELVMQRPASLNMLFTSRQERDIEVAIQSLATATLSIEAHAIQPDISLYVNNYLERVESLKIMPPQEHERIKESLVSKADGMFRWLYCQLLALRKCRGPRAVDKALESLPRNLDETYERVLGNISYEEQPRAQAILCWLDFSVGPIFLDQVAEVAAIEPTTSQLDETVRLFHASYALDFCPGLIRVCEETIHSCGPSGLKETWVMDSIWSSYVVKSLLKQNRTSEDVNNPEAGLFESIFAAACSGERDGPVTNHHRKIVAILLRHGANINSGNIIGSSMLSVVLVQDNEATLTQLLEHGGADLEARDHNLNTVLLHAIENENLAAVKILLDHGANVKVTNDKGFNLVHVAMNTLQDAQCLRIILEAGGEVNAQDLGGNTPLHLAIKDFRVQQVRMLLSFGANIETANRPGELPISSGLMKDTRWKAFEKQLRKDTEGDRIVEALLNIYDGNSTEGYTTAGASPNGSAQGQTSRLRLAHW